MKPILKMKQLAAPIGKNILFC